MVDRKENYKFYLGVRELTSCGYPLYCPQFVLKVTESGITQIKLRIIFQAITFHPYFSPKIKVCCIFK